MDEALRIERNRVVGEDRKGHARCVAAWQRGATNTPP